MAERPMGAEVPPFRWGKQSARPTLSDARESGRFPYPISTEEEE